MKPHIFHPAADEEYVQAVQYYADIELELGHRFYDEMERLIREVCVSPERFWQFDPPARRHLSGRTAAARHGIAPCRHGQRGYNLIQDENGRSHH